MVQRKGGHSKAIVLNRLFARRNTMTATDYGEPTRYPLDRAVVRVAWLQSPLSKFTEALEHQFILKVQDSPVRW